MGRYARGLNLGYEMVLPGKQVSDRVANAEGIMRLGDGEEQPFRAARAQALDQPQHTGRFVLRRRKLSSAPFAEDVTPAMPQGSTGHS